MPGSDRGGLHRFGPNAGSGTLGKCAVGGLVDIGACIDFGVPRKHARRRNTSSGERRQDLILAAARETVEEDGASAQSYTERGRPIIMGWASRHAFGA